MTPKHNIDRSLPWKRGLCASYPQQSSQPCIDELEIFSGDKNLALPAKAPRRVRGDFKHPLHKLAHINDGQYGNQKLDRRRQYRLGAVELAAPARIDRIEWARDRQGNTRIACRSATASKSA